ncbi:MAG: GNAT family N-acetyltransferase [Ktedonobacteraceae bacterium]|nr:GNAT family N-acetyltransferase [Ktedonobacteraceae bacterium]MBV9614713.1 GNAT family N-acetyltransferase [Ktedonobacteraceae bacterium]MBV9710560.1 GNAT family N-acetyltransferase [Ktedonobacteraceae bacterium]
MSTIKLRSISAAETYELRHRILRPHQTLNECVFPYDTAPGALHIGGFLGDQLIGVGSIVPDAREEASQPTSWRVRGVAVLEEVRGTGTGGKILQALINYARTQSLPAEMWGNGRANVKGFYERFGFVQEGKPFEMPGLGSHVYLVKILHPS